MPHQIDETIVESLAVLDSGFVELTGRVAVSDLNATTDSTLWLRLTKRGTKESHFICGDFCPTRSGQSSFRFSFESGSDFSGQMEDVFDAYLVLKNDDSEFVIRLPWPYLFGSWVVYPTIHGNLSIKKTTEQSENE